ncbi:MAG: TRAP transporter small permease [Puniceicoccales bacterium]
MKTLREILANLEELLGSILLLGVAGIMLLNVCSRYLFNSPFSWAEELSTILFVWLVMIGAALALKRQQHFSVTFLVERMSHRGYRFPLAIGNWLVLASCLLLLVCGLFYASWGFGTVTPAMGLSRIWLYGAIPFGSGLMVLRAIQQIRFSNTPPPQGGQELSES